MMRSGSKAFRGAAWMYGSQVAAIVAQFGYAAVTTRALPDTAFGIYAVGLAVTAFVTLIATGGLGQTVGRMHTIHPDRLSPLVSYAVLLGFAAAAVTIATIPFWTWLWGVPDAGSTIALLSIGALLGPLQGLGAGLSRRLGKFKQLALATLISNAIGMLVGAIFVLCFRSAESLVAFPLIAQVGVTFWGVISSDGLLVRLGNLASGVEDIAFSWKMTLSSLLSYGVYNVTKIATSRTLGASALGQWNRADVLATVPFQQLQTAASSALYPEFRHDIADGRRAHRVWTDMLVLTAWAFLSAGVAAAVVLPFVVPILFGPGWSVAQALIPILAISAALQAQSTILASAVEAKGTFSWIWGTQIFLLFVQVGIVAALIQTRSIVVAVGGIGVTALLRHVLHIILCARAGYLAPATLLRGYFWACVFSALVGGLLVALIAGVEAATRGEPVLLTCSLAVLVGAGVCGAFWGRNLPPVRIALKYGLLGRGREAS